MAKKEKKPWSTRKKVIVSILGTILTYVLVCFIVTGSQCLHMLAQTKSSRNVALGETRWNEVKDLPNSKIKLYSKEEIEKDPNLDIVDLYYFPSSKGNVSDYALILPGGGYFECNLNKVAFPAAATFNKADINCFVLGYRYGKYSSYYAPMNDLVKAVKYITENASTYKVNPTNYMLLGYSAGGHLASLYASPYGFQKYGLNEPSTVGLVYPWTAASEAVSFNGNIVQLGVDLFLNENGMSKFLGDKKGDKEERKKLDTNVTYTKEYLESIKTKFYVIHGEKDVLVNKKRNSDAFVSQLSSLGLYVQKDINKITSSDRVIYRSVSDGNHGFGLGIGTKAEGWTDDIQKLWNPNK